MKKTVTIGISSGIAAYKIKELIHLLTTSSPTSGVGVRVIMTQSATKMVSLQEFTSSSGVPPLVDLFPNNFDYKKILQERKVDHIQLADQTDLLVIAPATANIIAKLAHGIADDLLTTTALAATAPILLCPSMNVHMWLNPATQANIEILKNRGFTIMVPDEGDLACGYTGVGRLPKPKRIRNQILTLLSMTDSMRNKQVLITSGGTQEPLDDVRIITNRSSGKMGVALAEECYSRGAEVTLLRARGSVSPRYSISQVLFDTADELKALMKKYVPHSDICLHVAAVSDFTVAQKLKGKLSSKKAAVVKLIPRGKIVDKVRVWNPKIKLIAFKASVQSSPQTSLMGARALMTSSHAEYVVANDVGNKDHGFDSDTISATIITRSNKTFPLGRVKKTDAAKKLAELLTGSS